MHARRHSGFPKDIVSLSKAVTNSLGKEKWGEVDRSEQQKFVQDSSFARQPRQLTGAAFKEYLVMSWRMRQRSVSIHVCTEAAHFDVMRK